MDKQEINKELTELMGECWHEPWGGYCQNSGWICGKCKKGFFPKDYPDFFTNEGYGKLRDWYDGWDEERQRKFYEYLLLNDPEWETIYEMTLHAFHRDNLAPLMLEFLKEG